MKHYFRLVVFILLGLLNTQWILADSSVTVSPTSGNMLAGIAGGNTSESGKVAGFYSTWIHNQLALTVNTSDGAQLTSAGDIADPGCTLTATTYNGSTAVKSENLILANGATQTFMVVSLPKGYRFTGYTIVLQPNLNGVKLTTSSANPANSFQNTGDHATCFYETKKWDAEFKYADDFTQNFTKGTAPLSESECLAVAKNGEDWEMNPDEDADQEFIISRESLTPDDMGNRLYFWVGFNTSYYAFTIKSFELRFTAEGTFDAEVAPRTVGEATNYVTSPFTTSKIDLGGIEDRTFSSNAGSGSGSSSSSSVTRKAYTYENVKDVVGYMHLYQENAVDEDDGYPVASTGTITPVEVDGEGHYAFGNNTYYIEPPTTVSTTSGQAEQPIGFRIVGATFKCLWGTETEESTINLGSTCRIYRNTNNGLTQSLMMGSERSGGGNGSSNTNSGDGETWQIDEYGNLYIGSGEYKQYLACYGEGNTRKLSLGTSPTGDNAKWNLRVMQIGNYYRVYYKSDGNKYYYLYTKLVDEGSKSNYRGFLVSDGVAYPNSIPAYDPQGDYEAVYSTAPSTGSTELTLPGFNPGKYTLTVYQKDDKDGTKYFDPIEISSANDPDIKEYTFDGFNNDAVKFMISGLADGKQALVDVTLKLEALDPYIDQMTVVCTDPNASIDGGGKLKMTQTFTAADFTVNGGAFHFILPELCANDDVNITFEDLYSSYGDETYENSDFHGNSRYSFVTSPYFVLYDGVDDNGLYSDNYNPDYEYEEKIYTTTAGNQAFTFNNAEFVATNGGSFVEYPFSVQDYKNAGGSFNEITLNPNGTDNPSSGTYYLFTADETRYNIAPTTAWQHRSYAFYQMDVSVEAATYEPKVKFTKIYDKTYYGAKDTDPFYGVEVTAPYTDGGVEKQGYASTKDIFERIENILKPTGDETTQRMDDFENTDLPDSAKQILYLDFSKLAGIFQVTTAENPDMDSYSNSNAANCMIFLPEGSAAPNNNVAYKTKAGTFMAAHDIVLTDKQPFYSPYDIQVAAASKVEYTREVTVDKNGKVQNASLMLPFVVTVDAKGKHTNKDNSYFTLHTMQDNEALVLKNGSEYAYFPPVSGASETKANYPYLVNLESAQLSSTEGVSFIVNQGGSTIYATNKADGTINTDGTFTGDASTGHAVDAGEIEQTAGTYTFTPVGTYAGQQVPKQNGIFYFAHDQFVSSLDYAYNAPINVRPFRAYYNTEKSSTAKMSFFNILFEDGVGDVSTGLQEVDASRFVDMNAPVYDLQGRMVARAYRDMAGKNVQPGLYVVNGVKIIVK